MPELLDINTEPVKTAQSEAPGSEPSSWMPLSEEQRNTAPEAVKSLLEAKKWTSSEEIATGYSDLEKILGRGEHIFKPESPDDADGWTKYWQQITGISNASEYEFETDETVPFDDALIGRFREFSKKIHLNKEQSAGIVQFQREIIKEVMTAEAEAETERVATSEAEIDTIRKALVTKAGGEVAYQNMMVEARQVADELGIYTTLEKKGLASDPEIIGMLQEIKNRTKEGTILKVDEPTTTAKDPKAELKEITESDTFKNKFAPGRKELMKRYMELCTIVGNSENAPKRVQDG
ncbi:hypothetical protein LCGC14_1889080 [marine sediment metagenome]|uniref:Uncharacterized protein n=1 Tax=marine sediment metagenome TaxID=412755 RepID=A0A0F9FZY8_9ZZZZ